LLIKIKKMKIPWRDMTPIQLPASNEELVALIQQTFQCAVLEWHNPGSWDGNDRNDSEIYPIIYTLEDENDALDRRTFGLPVRPLRSREHHRYEWNSGESQFRLPVVWQINKKEFKGKQPIRRIEYCG